MMRRIALLALAAAGLVLAGPAVQAQESGDPETWEGSSITLPTAPQSGPVRAEATFDHRWQRTIRISIEATGTAPVECSMPGRTTSSEESPPATFGVDLLFGCNGTYTITATAETTRNSQFTPVDKATREGTVDVAMPAPDVTGVKATGGDRAITVEWDDMTTSAVDLSGYIVERSIDSGAYEQVASPGSDETEFVDSSLPADAGTATYRVASTRPSPEGRLTSQSASSEATPFVAAPTAPDDGDGTTPGGGDGTTPGTSPGDGTTPGTTPGGPTPGTRVPTPRLGLSGSFLPPLLRPSLALQVPPDTDDGFDEVLPYREPGEDDPVLPDDEMASLLTDDSAGRGMVIPIATALVLAVWAFHLRRLAKAARPLD